MSPSLAGGFLTIEPPGKLSVALDDFLIFKSHVPKCESSTGSYPKLLSINKHLSKDLLARHTAWVGYHFREEEEVLGSGKAPETDLTHSHQTYTRYNFSNCEEILKFLAFQS